MGSHSHTKKGVKCCSAVLGKQGLLAEPSHQICTSATTVCEVLPARRRDTWEVWILSGGLSFNGGTLSLFTMWLLMSFPFKLPQCTILRFLNYWLITIWNSQGSQRSRQMNQTQIINFDTVTTAVSFFPETNCEYFLSSWNAEVKEESYFQGTAVLNVPLFDKSTYRQM